jgi:maltose O-acetyltransferase
MVLKRFIAFVVASPLVPRPVRWRLLYLVGLSAKGTSLESGVRIRNANVYLGAGTYLNHGVMFEGRARITLGTRVAVGPGVMILTSLHTIGPSDWRAGGGHSHYAPVAIGDGTWIGANATILPGVTIGDGCVIAAGAVVRGDCPPDTMWAGTPATLKKYLHVAVPD